MLTSRKSEASIEFMMIIGMLSLFFVAFLGITSESNRDISESTVFAITGNVLGTVVNEINTAASIEGYYREFYIPDTVSGITYNVTIFPTLRLVKVELADGRNSISNIITGNVAGNVNPGTNFIENSNGTVRINER